MSLGSLAAYAPDSESEPDIGQFSGSDDEEHARAKNPRLAEVADQDSRPSSVTSQSSRPEKKVSRLVSYGPDDEVGTDDEEEDMELASNEEDPITESVPAEQMGFQAQNEHHQVTDANEVRIPPEPPGRCSRQLQEKINKFHEKMLSGQDLNRKIQDRKDFRNPSIYEKLIQFCGIDEKGTNYPPEIYNPRIFGKDSFYDELAKVQKSEMEKREKERKDKTKIEFVTGTKRPASAQGQPVPERKSKWDALPAQRPPSVGMPPAPKTTVIPAIGSIKKK